MKHVEGELEVLLLPSFGFVGFTPHATAKLEEIHVSRSRRLREKRGKIHACEVALSLVMLVLITAHPTRAVTVTTTRRRSRTS